MKKLLLTSQGLQKELRGAFLSLLDKAPEQIKVSFVVTASYGEEPNPIWLEVYREQLREFGITHIDDLDIKGKTKQRLEKIIADKDIIFVNGGNTFYLLKLAKETGFDAVIKNQIAKGKLYVGISAGSYIACPSIEQATWEHQDKNRCGLTDLSALNLVPFVVSAHFEEKHRSIIEQAAKSYRYPIVALYDTQAVLVEDDRYRVVGSTKREFFNGFKEKL